MKNLWSVFVVSETNTVPIHELRTIMRALDLDPTPDELEILTKQIDPSLSGMITFESLVEIMEDKLRDTDTLEDLLDQFKKLDKDQDGRIPNPEFKQFMTNMGQKMTIEQLEELMKEADPKGEGAFDIEDICQRLCPPKK